MSVSTVAPRRSDLERGRQTWLFPGLALLALLAAASVVALILTSDREENKAASIALAVLTSLSFVASGLVAWARRPENRTGLLMVAAGFLLLARPVSQAADDSLLFTAGVAGAGLAFAVLVHLILAFPEGRLRSRPERILVGATYVDAIVVQLAMLLVMDYHAFAEPRNLLLVRHDHAAHTALMVGQRVVAVAIMTGVVIVLARRWRSATPPLRRALAPVFVTGAVSVLVFGGALAVEAVSPPLGRVAMPVALVAFATVPIAFLVGLLRTRLARAAVGDLVVELGQTTAPGALRDALARALGDPSLELAYWVPQTGSYADLEGRPVELPAEGERATTLLEHGGRRIAALVHDPALRDDPSLVKAVCAAAGLALENERLQVELRARLEDLRASRARIVEAGDSERRRLERNLHDGAQQRLVSLSLALGLAESRLPGDPEGVRELVGAAKEEAGLALEELRELARGIHPAVLTDRGLAVALEGLATRSPLPIALDVAEERLPAPIEAAAYYLVSEALANAAKYSQANRMTVRVAREDGRVVVEAKDDGVGGADPARGSGLRGLADRVEALDGRLVVASAVGAGTTVRAEIPCA